jgi:hypothetical protein
LSHCGLKLCDKVEHEQIGRQKLPYILAYKSRNFERILNSFSLIRLIHGSQKEEIFCRQIRGAVEEEREVGRRKSC